MLSLSAISSLATSSAPTFGILGGTIHAEFSAIGIDAATIYAATEEFITRATDTPANQPFLGTLLQPVSFKRSLVTQDGFGELSVGYGEIEIINAEADYDLYVGNYAVDGQEITLKVGSNGVITAGIVDPYSSFVTVAALIATGWNISEESMRVSVRDKGYKLEVPAQSNLYIGGDDIEGNDELKGKRKPTVIGSIFSATAIPLIPNEFLYQVNDGAVDLLSVYDSGLFLANQTADDYPTVAALRAATPTPGSISTCIAEGYFRLGAAPVGIVTFAAVVSATLYTTAAIRALIERECDVAASEFDDATFDALTAIEVANDEEIGYFLDPDSTETVAEVAGALMRSKGGWCGFSRLGFLEVRHFGNPTLAPLQRYDENDFITITKERLPDGIDPVIQNFRVTYQHNDTVLTDTDMVGAVTDDERVRQKVADKVASPTSDNSASIVGHHPLAHDPDPLISHFTLEPSAVAEADNRMALYGVERSVYRFTVKDHVFGQDVGDTIHITHPRFGLDEGTVALVVEVDDDLEKNETTILAFV